MERRSSLTPHVGIVGAGFSGTMVAVHLAARGLRVTLIDRSGRFAEGLAYGTREPVHLLNIRASGMSAFADDPDHFTRWLMARGEGTGASFAPRRVYRRYLADILEASGDAIARLSDEAVGIEDGGVRLSSGVRLQADAVVVAAGNLPPQLITMLANESVPYVNDPWSEQGRQDIASLAGQDGDVLVIGTGLTMVDTVLALDAHGFAGRVMALSRRGLLPRPHACATPVPIAEPPSLRLRALVRWVRQQAQSGDWRSVVDSLRPLSIAIWRNWSQEERGRFLRHARPWWDVHRHRIAPDIWVRLNALIDDGRLAINGGRVTSLDGNAVGVRSRGQAMGETYQVVGIINCTGPRGDLRRSGNALIEDLLRRGQASVDAFGLGLRIDDDLRIVGDPADPRLYAVGPMTRGTFWEAVAVPEIRVQAQALAGVIADELASTQAQAAAS